MEKENGALETIIVEREERIVPQNGGKSILKISKYINPSVTSVAEASIPSLTHLSETISDDNLSKWCLSKIHFKGWRNPQKNWTTWIDQLVPLNGLKWNQAMICEAIVSSIYKIEIDKELILGLAEFWCYDTNTFVFPWGEATITLEDMLILGGFSVLGEPVTSPLTGDLLFKNISDELQKEHRAFNKPKARKASEGAWMNRFMGSNSTELEHVAFLSLWLSRYVFPDHPVGVIRKQVFSVAVHLAQGTAIALAPAVLTSIYSNLTSLKKQLLEYSRNSDPSSISVWGPFQFLQIWAWEHFPLLRPKEEPNSLIPGEPRIARWNKLKSKSKLSNVRSILKCSENFQWRPYVTTINNWRCPLFYKEKEELADVRVEDVDELQSFFRCLRSCEIFGLNGAVIELYLPHRVARQFGYDQDLPGQFCRANSTWESAWKTYDKCTKNAKFYVRSQFLESNVTMRYHEWWKQSIHQDAVLRDIVERKEGSENSKDKSDSCSASTKCSAIVPKSQSRPEAEDLSDEDDDELTLSIKFNLKRHQATATDIPTSSTAFKPSSNSQTQTSMAAKMSSEVGNKKRKSDTKTVEQNLCRKVVVEKAVEKVVEKEKKIGDSIHNPLTLEDYEEGTMDKPVILDD